MELDTNNRSVFSLHYQWKESFWTKSYCLITTGGANIEAVKKYIENQGE